MFLAATNIHRTLEEFRIEWAELMAHAGTSPTAESIAVLIDRAKKFRTDVDGLVLQETKDWVTEFQNSMVQMEKDIVSQVAALKAQVDKAAQAKEAAEQPGGCVQFPQFRSTETPELKCHEFGHAGFCARGGRA